MKYQDMQIGAIYHRYTTDKTLEKRIVLMQAGIGKKDGKTVKIISYDSRLKPRRDSLRFFYPVMEMAVFVKNYELETA